MVDFMLISYVIYGFFIIIGILFGASIVLGIQYFRSFGRLSKLAWPTSVKVSQKDEDAFIKYVAGLDVPKKLYLMRAMLGVSYRAVIRVDNQGITIESCGGVADDDDYSADDTG